MFYWIDDQSLNIVTACDPELYFVTVGNILFVHLFGKNGVHLYRPSTRPKCQLRLRWGAEIPSLRCKALDAAMAFGHCLIPVPDASKVKPKHSGCIRAWVQWRRTSGAGAERGLADAAAPTKEALSPKLEWKACDYEQLLVSFGQSVRSEEQ